MAFIKKYLVLAGGVALGLLIINQGLNYLFPAGKRYLGLS